MTETISSLYAYQSAVLPQMERGEPIYLGFDPGLGKSRTALEAAKRRKVGSLLVICPASGRYVWEKECRLWWPGMPFRIVSGPSDLGKLRGSGIVLITYGLLSQKDSPYAAAVAKGAAYDMTIVDEAAAVKNVGANRTRAILKTMLPKLGYVVPMSGTPAPNHAGELFPILRAVYPKALAMGSENQPMNQWQFEDAFCKVVSKRFGMGRPVRVIEGSKNLPELRRRMQGFMMRVRKEDVMKELPPLRWDVAPVQAKAGAAVPVPILPALGKMSDEEFLKYLAGSSDEHVMRLRRLLGLAKLDAAIEYIQDFIDNLPLNRKVLIFAHHKEVIEGLATGLAASSPAIITGATSPRDRALSIDSFLQDDTCRMFIGNIQAAGTGITLVGPKCKCSDVIFVESTYSVGDNHQAACRVHRIGQQDAVVVRMLSAHGTIDDRIADILARKAQDFAQLFN